MPRGDNFRQHASVYAKLMANVIEDGDCWVGTERERASYGYVRVSLRGDGQLRKCMAHILVFCALALRELEGREPTRDEIWWAYWEFRCSGLEIDHKCNNPPCRRPDHLQPGTRSEQEIWKHERRALLPVVNVEPEPWELEF